MDKQEVIKGLKAVRTIHNGNYAPAIDEAIKLLGEEKKGKWVKEIDRTFHWHCSTCGYVIGFVKMDCNYCPNCGARMVE